MSTNQPLFDSLFPDPPLEGHRPLTGEERKYTGMETVLIDTPEAYKERFYEVVKGFLKGYVFNAEDVTGIVGRPPGGKSNVVGALMSKCSRDGLTVFTGRMVKAERAGMNATLLMEWRRL